MKYLKNFESAHQLEEHPDFGSHYMFFKNIESIKHYISEIEQLDQKEIGELLDNGHDWAADHIAVATDCIQQVSNFLRNEETMHMDDQVDEEDVEDAMYPEVVNPAEGIQEVEEVEEVQNPEIVESFQDFTKNN